MGITAALVQNLACGALFSIEPLFAKLGSIYQAMPLAPGVSLRRGQRLFCAWSGRGESNPRLKLGKLSFYH